MSKNTPAPEGEDLDLDHEQEEAPDDPAILTEDELLAAGPGPKRGRAQPAGSPRPRGAVRVTIQMGHVARTRGRTGTHREQEFTRELAPRIEAGLRAAGHQVAIIGADDRVPQGDVFVALHTDGSDDGGRRGASVGYPDGEGEALAAAWKRAHQSHGYPAGFNNDNYTAALREYYGFKRAEGHRWRMLAEHGTTTNADDEAWLFDNLDQCAAAHVDAICELAGRPTAAPPPSSFGDEHPILHSKGPGGGAVAHLQRLLGLADDGRFGRATRAAVEAAQGRRKLARDGVVGPNTWAVVHPLLRPGDSGEAVTEVQQALGVEEENYGPLTEEAVRSLQAAHGLDVDGKCGPKTYLALFS